MASKAASGVSNVNFGDGGVIVGCFVLLLVTVDNSPDTS